MPRARFRFTSMVVVATLSSSLVPLVAATGASAEPLAPVSSNVGCDPIDPAACLLPFPNDFFTTTDPTTDTGRRINFSPAAMPRNGTEVTEGGEGKPVDPTEWNRNDGFSPGSMVMTFVAGLDLHKTWGTEDRPHSEVGINEHGYFDHRDHIADIGLYEKPDAPIAIVNAETGERHPFWSEMDLHPEAGGDSVLIMRPAVNFEEGTRYVVAMRNLKDTEGNVIAAPEGFTAYRSGSGADATRQAHFDSSIFPVLEGAGIAKDDLYLAWDFTVASERNLAERVLHMRDDAFGQLGDTDLGDGIVQGTSPQFVVDRVSEGTDNWTDSHGVAHSLPYRDVHGRVTVPNYLDRIQQTEGHVRGNQLPADAPAPGSRLLDLDLDGLPDQNPVESTVEVPFQCRVPLNGKRNNMTLYGHGLLGARSQVSDIRSPQRNGPFIGCAADWWGMSTPDLPTVAAILGDISNFPSLPDRAQQGFLNFMFLGRAGVHAEGFATDPAFQQDGESLINVATESDTPLYYDGNSQGGIMGGSLVAVSPDIKRGILGVPGMNYSTLLNRSVDWEGTFDGYTSSLDPTDPESAIPPYAVPYYESYKDPIERQIGFSLIQMLWDRGEANGFAHHMTDDPYENTPSHEIMLQVAWSDHQVTNHAAEVEARTIGAPIMTPGLPEGRHWEMDPYFTDTASYPYKGSALVYWDSGNATPPNGNLPPEQGSDPHGHGRREPAAGWQEAQWLLTGWMIDVCQGGDYLTLQHPANGGTPSCKEPNYDAGSRVPGAATSLDFTPSSDTSGDFSDDATFAVSLTDAQGVAIAGESVTFEFAGRTLEATTNGDGVAAVTTKLTEEPGSYQLKATHDATEWYDASTATSTFTVTREDTVTDLVVTGKGSKRRLRATLTDTDSGEGIAGQTIRFFADGSSIGSATTDASGTATLAPPLRMSSGRYTYVASFSGTAFYLPSEATTG